MNRFAHFVRFPRTLEDQRRPYLCTDQQAYEVLETVVLDSIDYGNFISNLDVEREYLAGCYRLHQAGSDGVLHAVLVRRREWKDGVLVVPDRDGYVIWAAYLSDTDS